LFPIKDYIPRKYPPHAARLLIVLNTLFFIYELGLSQKELIEFSHILGVVPARYFNPDWAEWLNYPDLSVLPFFTHMFLHSGFFHFIINMWILWVFADNVEDVLGPVRFLIFYLLCGLFAVGGHMLINFHSTVPVIGASGAIAGVMGAYLVLYPGARVLTLIPIFIFPFFIDLPAIIFLGLWFFMQFLSGLSSSLSSSGPAGVAWWAHAFGFLAGLFLVGLFRNNKRTAAITAGKNSSSYDEFDFF